MELLKNFGTTNLSGAINNSQTTLTVDDGSVFPNPTSPDQFRIRIDNEVMMCYGRSSNLLTVQRAVDMSTAVSHSSGARVDHVLTAGALAQFRLDERVPLDGANFLPQLGNRLLLPNDDLRISHDDGTVLTSFLCNRIKPFDITGFSWFNQGGATYDLTKGFLYLEVPPAAGANHRGIEMALPATPFKVRMLAYPMFFSINYSNCGMQFYESSSGKAESLHFIHSTDAGIEQNKWNSRTSYNGTRTFINLRGAYSQCNWMQMEHDGTTLSYRISFDGYNWFTVSSVAKNNWFDTGPDKIAIYASADNTDWKSTISVLSWEIY